ncbi:MAG: AAA family ATPase [Luteitalea sp.]|nr:AAA family ATPase [Luteitalea sp.]
MLIVLSGLPGVGKTTIARTLARAAAAVYVRIDSIEQALRNAGWRVEGEGYSVAYALAEDNLRLGSIVVADSVNPWPLTRSEWRSVAGRAGAPALDVEVVCSDADEHRRRIESRAPDISGHRLPTWQEVTERDYRAWDREHLVVDTAHLDVEQSVRTILEEVARSAGKCGVTPPRHATDEVALPGFAPRVSRVATWLESSLVNRSGPRARLGETECDQDPTDQ